MHPKNTVCPLFDKDAKEATHFYAAIDAMAASGDKAKRAFDAKMPLGKIDIATIEPEIRG